MNALNLDDLVKESRTITHKGVVYPVEDMTVENFIETQKKAKQIEKLGKDADEVLLIEAYVEVISRFIPSMEMEVMKKLPLTKLMMILSFVQSTPEAEKNETPSAPVAEGEAGKE